ncbi:MAG: PEP-CTERM sorting domain-containing protein [bacterium]|nr:PEP-CTERM sorting domain-containing protein [bacterium]
MGILPRVATGVTITFDDTQTVAPSTFSAVQPGGPFGPTLDFGSVVISGGVIGLAVTPADQAATTLPNFYATTDFLALADGSMLSGTISGVFSGSVHSVSLDVSNGNVFAADFILTAFDGAAVVGSDVVSLAGFANSGFVGLLSVSASSITSFTVTSTQPGSTKLFAVDTVVFETVPEPASTAFLGLGLVLLARRCLQRRS